MADKRDESDQGPQEASYAYHDSLESSESGVTADCADCGGTGKVQLLVTTRLCETCGGTGKANAEHELSCVSADAEGESPSGHWVTQTAFDGQDEAVGQRQWFVPDPPKRAK